jgi:hypothetical protein
MGGGKGPGRILAAGLVGLVLVGAIGLASRSHTPSGGGHTRSISHDILIEYALLLLVALAVVVVPVGVYLFIAGRREEIQALPARKNWAPAVLATMIGVSIVAVVLLRYLHDHRGRHDNPISQLLGLAHQGSKTAGAVRFDWGPVIVVSALMVLALGALGWMILQHVKSRPETEGAAADELVLALERTIADLRAEADPRKAVIAAYAQMELALADAGLPRTPSEAPREYLGRVLPEVGAQNRSVERLTRLFERAKFSPHTIDDAMKEEAIGALESLRDDLQGTP